MSIKTFILTIIIFCICTKQNGIQTSNNSPQHISSHLETLQELSLKFWPIDVCCANNKIVKVEYKILKDFKAFVDEFEGINFYENLDYSVKEILAGRKKFTALLNFSADSFKLFLKIHCALLKYDIKLFIEILEYNNKNEVMDIYNKLYGYDKNLVSSAESKNEDFEVKLFRNKRIDRAEGDKIFENKAPIAIYIFQSFRYLGYKTLIQNLNCRNCLMFSNVIPFILSYLEYRPVEFIVEDTVSLCAGFCFNHDYFRENQKKSYKLKILIIKMKEFKHNEDEILTTIWRLIKIYEIQYLNCSYILEIYTEDTIFPESQDFILNQFYPKNRKKILIITFKPNKIFYYYSKFYPLRLRKNIQVVINDLKNKKLEDMSVIFKYD